MKAQQRAQAKKQARVWVEMGWHHARIDERLYDVFNATPIETSEILKEIRHEQAAQLADINRPEFLAQQMTRLEALAVKAQEEGNLAVALGAYKELNQLAKLHAS